MLLSESIKDNLDKVLDENDTVFLIAHDRPDMDAIASCIGMNLICNSKNKNTYIVINDSIDTIEKATKTVIVNTFHDFNIIKAKDVKEFITPKSLLIVLDTNKKYMISLKDDLELFSDIFIIDHHKTDENTIKARYLFTDDSISSTCEEVSDLLDLYGIDVNEKYANYLLAGIVLDTNKFSKNVSSKTYSVASKLIEHGANATLANDLFLEDYEHDRAMQRLINNTTFNSYTYAISSSLNNEIYDNVDVAKAADYLLKFDVTASFAIAYIDSDTISISARSKGIIDVSKIMSLFGGGGYTYSAAAKVKGLTINEIIDRLNEILIPTSYLENNKDEIKLSLIKK